MKRSTFLIIGGVLLISGALAGCAADTPQAVRAEAQAALAVADSAEAARYAQVLYKAARDAFAEAERALETHDYARAEELFAAATLRAHRAAHQASSPQRRSD